MDVRMAWLWYGVLNKILYICCAFNSEFVFHQNMSMFSRQCNRNG